MPGTIQGKSLKPCWMSLSCSASVTAKLHVSPVTLVTLSEAVLFGYTLPIRASPIWTNTLWTAQGSGLKYPLYRGTVSIGSSSGFMVLDMLGHYRLVGNCVGADGWE